MMLQIGDWMRNYVDKAQELFGERLVFVGLQGSRARGEATEESDIDVVLILDEVNVCDLKAYRCMLDTLPERELVCGFISGKAELEGWERSDLFQFCRDTIPVIGDLSFAEEKISEQDVRRAVRIGACNLYHGAVHNMLHGRDSEMLKGLYKSAAFVLQAKHFCETKTYVRRKDELLEKLSGKDREILEICMMLRQGGEADPEKLSEKLISFAGELIREYAED